MSKLNYDAALLLDVDFDDDDPEITRRADDGRKALELGEGCRWYTGELEDE